MITDAVMTPVLSAVTWVLGLLPVGSPLPLPALDGFWSLVAQVDSLVPIWPVLYAALGLLAAGMVFVTVRLVLTVWNLVWP